LEPRQETAKVFTTEKVLTTEKVFTTEKVLTTECLSDSDDVVENVWIGRILKNCAKMCNWLRTICIRFRGKNVKTRQ
jgi:hypothetical protein